MSIRLRSKDRSAQKPPKLQKQRRGARDYLAETLPFRTKPGMWALFAACVVSIYWAGSIHAKFGNNTPLPLGTLVLGSILTPVADKQMFAGLRARQWSFHIWTRLVCLALAAAVILAVYSHFIGLNSLIDVRQTVTAFALMFLCVAAVKGWYHCLHSAKLVPLEPRPVRVKPDPQVVKHGEAAYDDGDLTMREALLGVGAGDQADRREPHEASQPDPWAQPTPDPGVYHPQPIAAASGTSPWDSDPEPTSVLDNFTTSSDWPPAPSPYDQAQQGVNGLPHYLVAPGD